MFFISFMIFLYGPWINKPNYRWKKGINNKNFDFYRYDGAGHGFMYYDRPYYRQQQSVDAWDKIFKFTEKNLRK